MSKNKMRIQARSSITAQVRADTSRMTAYAASLLNEWGEAPFTASASRIPVASATKMGFTPTEFEYAAAVQFLLEEDGWSRAREFVVASREWLNSACDGGFEPWEVAQYVEGRA